MEEQHHYYALVEKAIDYLNRHQQSQPSLDQIASAVNLSPFHFQRVFTSYTGLSPKQFLQVLTVQHAKMLLRENKINLVEAAEQAGLSGTGRLHDLFVKIEAMTPAEYKNAAKGLLINYYFYQSRFGKVLIASTKTGICYITFNENETLALKDLCQEFNGADLIKQDKALHQSALSVINGHADAANKIQLHLKGSPFQLKVWKALLSIPEGQVQSYGALAAQLQLSGAARAVGTAIGKNPIAILIPCHRVIQQSGALGGYRWGLIRKQIIIACEQAQL